jgi:hypothetical protein
MKKFIPILTICFILLSNISSAQWIYDSVDMAPNITKDVFYNFENSTVHTQGNANWVIALGTSFSTAAIWANHTAGVRVFRTGKHVSDWNSISLADTALEQLFNPDTNWDYGAMNAKAVGFNYGWGIYNTVNHNVYGDSIFIIAQGNNYYQLVVDSMLGLTNDYYTRVAPVGMSAFTGSNIFKKSPKFSNSNFIYVKAGAMGLSDTTREPNNAQWDILFTKYIATIPDGNGGFIPYPVKGVLSNRGTKTARIANVNVESVLSNFTTYPLNTVLNNIGFDWKVLNGSTFDIVEDLSYLVESKNGSLWQLEFTSYSGTTGIVGFNKRKLMGGLAINDVNNNATNFGVYPNPVNNNALLSLSSKSNLQAILTITDMQGKIISNKIISVQQGINGYNINMQSMQSGNYIVNISGKNLSASKIISKL